MLSQLHAMTYALLLFICPWMQNFDHDLPVLHSIVQWPIPLDILVWGAVIALAIGLRHSPLVAFGLAWYALQWLPTILIPRLDLLSERNLYLPFAGLVPALVSLTGWAANRLIAQFNQLRIIRATFLVIGLLVVADLCVLTYQRNLLYRDAVALWTDTVEKSPQKARPHNNLGHSYALSGDWDRAVDEFRTAARLDPDYALAQKNLRNAYLRQVGRQ
jgi:tetratricopeptide (TPR) repeat protein